MQKSHGPRRCGRYVHLFEQYQANLFGLQQAGAGEVRVTEARQGVVLRPEESVMGSRRIRQRRAGCHGLPVGTPSTVGRSGGGVPVVGQPWRTRSLQVRPDGDSRGPAGMAGLSGAVMGPVMSAPHSYLDLVARNELAGRVHALRCRIHWAASNYKGRFGP
jgi:hypothetical protein